MKPIVRHTRLHTDEDGTFGVWVLPEGQMFFILEPEMNDNLSNISCIPAGMYTVDYEPSNKYGYAYYVKDVARRNYIKVHSGTIEDHTEGCIIPGNDHGYYKNKKAVLNSKDAVNQIETILNKESFTLIIKESF